jgi:hypothetical protein
VLPVDEAAAVVVAVSERLERRGEEEERGIAHGGGGGFVLGGNSAARVAATAAADTGRALPQVRQAPAGADQLLRLRLRRVRRHAPRSRPSPLPCRLAIARLCSYWAL